jgi:hypothetical protein
MDETTAERKARAKAGAKTGGAEETSSTPGETRKAGDAPLDNPVVQEPMPDDPQLLQARLLKSFTAIVEDFQQVFHTKRVDWANRVYPEGKTKVVITRTGDAKVEEKKSEKDSTEDTESETAAASSVADYSVAAAEMALILWASPELRKGLAQFAPVAPVALSLLDNGWNKQSAKRAIIPGAIGVGSVLATSRVFR